MSLYRKIIYGWNCDYDSLVYTGKIELLETRRERLTLNFARKCTLNERFDDWFVEKNANVNYNLRSEKKYEESFARTERMRKSPLFYMRRALNSD